MSVKIIVDSTIDVTNDIKEKLTIVPLTVNFGETEYIDGITITHNEFYEKLIESDVIPTTSQPTPDAFAKVFEEIKNNNDTAVVITVSSKLSGTYQSATIAASDYPDNIIVVDGKTVAIGTGILAKFALELAQKGLSAKEIAETLENEKNNVFVIAMLDTLEYLKKGGRISKTAALAGTLLSIKPVVSIYDGVISILGKARGSKQANNFLITEIQKYGINFEKPILLGYTGLSDILLKKYIEDSKDIWEGNVDNLNYTPIGSVVGTHAGPGAVAVAFFKTKA